MILKYTNMMYSSIEYSKIINTYTNVYNYSNLYIRPPSN